jgi:hypothetical protein
MVETDLLSGAFFVMATICGADCSGTSKRGSARISTIVQRLVFVIRFPRASALAG